MTADEREWCQRVHRQAMDVYGIVGNIELDADAGSKQAKRANRAALAALALATEAMKRIRDADLSAEAQEVAASGYSLSALADASPPTVQE
jgi:hypothetical protein